MAAVHAAMLSHLKTGDRVVASRALFGSCHWIVSTLLPRYGIATEFVDGADLAQWAAALSKPAALVLLETPSNPMLEIVDMRAVCDLAHKAGAIVVVDNVFATPLLQKPMDFGADVVVYSATKHFDGQGRVLGGAVLGSRRSGSRTRCSPSSATPARRSARSMPGPSSRGWRRCTCACRPCAGPPPRSPTCWPNGPRLPACCIRSAPTIRSRNWPWRR